MKSKAVESWAHRVARMHPRTSRMEVELLKLLSSDKELREAGWHMWFQKPFCLVKTTPDFYLAKGDVAIGVYIDGEKVHLNKQLRDQELRDLLWQKRHVKPLAFSYPTYSEAWRDRLFKQIKEALKEN